MFAIVCWFTLATSLSVCSQPMPYAEALQVYTAGTFASFANYAGPFLFPRGSKEYARLVGKNV